MQLLIMCETEEPNSIFDLIFHGHDIKVPSAQFGNNPNAERGFEQFPIIFRSEIRTKASRSIWNQQLSLFFFPPWHEEYLNFPGHFFFIIRQLFVQKIAIILFVKSKMCISFWKILKKPFEFRNVKRCLRNFSL